MQKCLIIFAMISTLFSQELILVETPQEADDDEAGVEAVEDVEDVSTAEVFVPSAEWQEVMPGQQVPAGLHVRLNIQTGKKEARIIREELEEKKDDISHETLKEALKNIKADFKPPEDNVESVPSNFRSMDELKAVLGEVDMNVETDIEIIKKLFKKYHDSSSDEDRSVILEDLEYYSHQYDNALLFVELGGITDIVLPSLNSSSPALRQQASLLVGGAAQSNPHFQMSCLEAGLLETLLRLTVLEADPLLAARAFSALSAVVRNFPQAQNKLLRQGGLGLLVRLFDHRGKLHEKLKVKILTLLSDLLAERDAARLMTDDAAVKRRQQYQEQDLESQIEEVGFCQVFNQVLILPKSDRQAKR